MKRPAHLAPLPPANLDAGLHEWIDHVFGNDGPFAKAFPGYQPRDGQIEFAHAVADGIIDGVCVLAEAETGTGKSFGALVPAVKSVANRGGKVVYVTANIALQEQIVKKDLPTLQKLLGEPFSFALAKGFSNYLCQDKLIESKGQIDDGKIRLPSVRDEQAFNQIFHWQTHTGDFSELDFEPSGLVKSLASISSDDCLGKKCRYWLDDCHPRKARKAFQNASVIVTNYHLYFLDLDMKRRGASGILPDHRVLLMDEFHKAAEIARSYLGERASEGSVKTALEGLDAKGPRAEKLKLPPELDPELRSHTIKVSEAFFKDLAELAKDPKRYKARINRPHMFDGGDLIACLFNVADKYLRAAEMPELEAEAREWLRSRSSLANRLANVVAGAQQFDDESQIFYIDLQQAMGARGSPLFGVKKAALVREPLSPADTLKRELFDKPENPRAIVGFSATLRTSSRSSPFGYVARQVGMTKFDECVAESPFDFSKTAFIVPKDVPDSQNPNFASVVADKLLELTSITGGRTLGLFTSYRVMEVAARKLEEGVPFTVLVQGREPRMQLIKKFKDDETSVLLGTESFWTGVDVPGDSLLAVFMDKLPFDHVDDPVLDAVKEKDKNWFKNYYLPKAAIAFKQGFGRLIRSVDDRGVVVCCDRKITNMPYGKTFLHLLPEDVKVFETLDVVAKYVAKR